MTTEEEKAYQRGYQAAIADVTRRLLEAKEVGPWQGQFAFGVADGRNGDEPDAECDPADVKYHLGTFVGEVLAAPRRVR